MQGKATIAFLLAMLLLVPTASAFQIGTLAVPDAAAVLLIGGFIVYKYTKRKEVGVIVMVFGGAILLGIFNAPFSVADLTQGVSQQGMVECGKAATLTHYAYDKEADSETKAGPTWYVYNTQTGAKLNAGTTTNSTSLTTCDVVNIYGDDDANWYTDPVLNYKITTEAETLTLDAHSVATESSLNLTLLDSDMNAVSGDDNAINNVDFYTTLSAQQSKIFYAKLTNNQANKEYKLCGAAVLWNNLKGAEIKETGWTEVPCWDEIVDASVSVNNDTHNATLIDFDRCYKAATPVILHEYDDTTIKMAVEANTPDPAVNNYTMFGVQFVDCGYALGSDGQMHFDMYVHDSNERHSEVGVAEDETSVMGATSGFLCETQ